MGLASTPQSSLRVSSAFWSRYSGPIDEASSGENYWEGICRSLGSVEWCKDNGLGEGQSPVSGKWHALASLAVLLGDRVHQLLPLVAESCRSSQAIRSLFGDLSSDLGAAAT